MKKLIIVLIFLAAISPIFAQNNSEEKDGYYINVSVERIFPTSQGYIVQYQSQSGIKTIGIQNSWFTDAGGRADIVRLPRGKSWPSMSVFYSNGEFSHLRLYVSPVRSHTSWGSIPQGTDVNRFFLDEDFNIQY